jgi:hypothetical protein
MTPAPHNDDPLSAYLNGDPDAVRAAAPPEPTEAEWNAVRARVAARLPRRARRWPAVAAALVAAVALVAVGAALWPSKPRAPEVVTRPAPAPVAPNDPLAAFDVLPIVTAEEVVLYRVPGAGALPVGAPPFAGDVVLVTVDDVQFTAPHDAWPNALTASGDAPMLFVKSR